MDEFRELCQRKKDELGSVLAFCKWAGCSVATANRWLKGKMPSNAWYTIIMEKFKKEAR
jgi:hypothetical protein